jgi:outer membrane protein assembly factor BamB
MVQKRLSMAGALAAVLLLAAASMSPAAENWPQFRGPTGDGQSDATGLPLRWSEKENVRWKTPIHGRGWSSPVIWDQQVWMTTATEDGRRLFAVAVDCRSGAVLHDLKLFDVAQPDEIHALNSYASPSPVIEAGRVYVHFGTYGTACLDTATGRTLWERRDLKCDHFRGPGSSPVLFENLLILHYDGIDLQYLVALDKATGRTAWRTDRSTDFGQLDGDLRKAYATPLVVEAAGRLQMLSPGAQAAMAYDPRTGKELWKILYPGGFSNVSRPLYGHGLAYLNTGFGQPQLWAVRPDGRGDVTATHVAWKLAKGVPAKPSPVLVGDLIFMVNDTGIASCVEAKTGRVVWHERIGGEYSASLLSAEGRVYAFSHDGRSTVFRPGRQYEALAVNRLDSGFMASPAVAGRAMFLRTKTDLYRIETP